MNKHCPSCQFQDLCQARAEKEDNLSLLANITPSDVQHYEKKGIFTVKQLSYVYKPRRPSKRAKNLHATHKPELQALAIRTGKIYLQQIPTFSRQDVELFFDIEGIPDRQLYYLIGLLVCEENTCIYHAFWADSDHNEEHMWSDFLGTVSQYPSAPLYHYVPNMPSHRHCRFRSDWLFDCKSPAPGGRPGHRYRTGGGRHRAFSAVTDISLIIQENGKTQSEMP